MHKLVINNSDDVMGKENINFTFVNLSAGTLYRAKAYTTIKNVSGDESQAAVLLGKYNLLFSDLTKS